MIECDPTSRVEMLSVALPVAIAPVPSVVVPSLNVTVPVAVDGVNVAANVTATPNVDGFLDDANATLEFALLTVCVSTEEVLPLKFALPP